MKMSTFLKRCREVAGLTQAQLAERMGVSTVAVQNWESGKTNISYERYPELSLILNIPVDRLIKETIIEVDKTRVDNWPDFLFSEYTNEVANMLHLNMAQQDMFGLLYIYNTEFREYDYISRESFDEYLNNIPYGFIDRVGSIQFMNQADGLYRVLRHVSTSFLLKVLKLNPDSEFNVRKMSKNLICEFIDEGYKEADVYDEEGYEEDGCLRFDIKMRRAKIMLPILEESGPIHFTDDNWANPIRDDIPEKVSDGILESLCITKEAFKMGYRKDEYTGMFAYSLQDVTNYKNKKDRWILEINDNGRKLLEWFKE
jgi:Helix-turn-helix.